MSMASRFSKALLIALAASLAALPASADVKAGVDAWGRGEYESAVKQWRDLAIKGDADAQFNMGQAYKMGRGVKADLNVALDWYRKASTQGHLQAADSYGHLLHYQGKIADALPYLQSSADRGDPRAQYLLATELFNGEYIKKDWVRAYALMTRASSAGLNPASRSLAQMDEHIPLDQRQAAMVLSGELEQRANRARSTQMAGPSASIKPAAPAAKSAALPSPKTMPVQRPTAAKAVPSDGAWRIQLGAFGTEKAAKSLWNILLGRVDSLAALQPHFPMSGKITRLQAGAFASKAAAQTACSKVKAAGQDCMAVSR